MPSVQWAWNEYLRRVPLAPPCAEVVAERAAGEFERDVGCAPRLPIQGVPKLVPIWVPETGCPHPGEQDVNVVAAVAEELAAAERLFAVHPAARLALRVLFGPDRKLEEVAVGPCLEQALHLGRQIG